MKEYLKIILLVVFFVIAPVSLFDSLRNFFSSYCEPRLSCLRISELLIFVVFICSVISAAAISFSYYIFCHRKKLKLTTKDMKLISIVSIGLSIISANVMMLGEMMGGVVVLVFSWLAFSFLVGAAVFKFGK